jgi:RNA polymerase sigma factor (sigma-70 family)
MNDDAELLRRYSENGAEDAFTELVRRHVNLVYSAALRQLNGDSHLAADATQIVFTDLARKAGTLLGHRVLAGWLFTSTRYATAKLVRGEQRRHAREVEAQLMQDINHADSAIQLDWQRVRPVLDEVIGELSDADREAILLRFFEGRDYASVGAQLSLSDNTARMRVERALDKLRVLLQRRGVKSTSAALGMVLAHQAVTAAPAGLAVTVAGAALAGGATAAGIAAAGTATAGGAAAWMNFMSMTKLQLGISSALAVAGATGFVIEANTNSKLRDEVARLRGENAAYASLREENLKLGRAAVEVEDMRRDDVEFERVQREAGALKTRLQALARAEEARQRTSKSDQVFDISALDQTPVVRFQGRPQYPFEMRRAGIGGEVVVDFVVDTNGEVQNAQALRSSRQEFEPAAVAAVSKWKFKPGRKGGQDVLTHMQVPIVFSLEGQTRANPAPQSSETDGSRPENNGASSVKLAPFDVVGLDAKSGEVPPTTPRE